MIRKIIYASFCSLAVCAGSAFAADSQQDEARIAYNNHCRTCHSIQSGDNRLGPAMYGIFRAKAGTAAGFRGYSGSLTGFTWDEATLDRFIANPVGFAANTTMIAPPVDDPAERRKIIPYLKSISGR